VLPKILAVPALVAMGTFPCQANHQVFSVQNLTSVPWDLVDETEAASGHGYRLDLLSPDTVQENPRILKGKARFTLHPGATLTFLAQTGPRCLDYLTLRLQSGPGSARLPASAASLHLPVIYGSWEEACGPDWEPFAMNAFVIRDDGTIAIRYLQTRMGPLPGQEPNRESPKALPRARPIRRVRRTLGDECKTQPGKDLPVAPSRTPMVAPAEDPDASAWPLLPVGRTLPEERKTEAWHDLAVVPPGSPVEALREDLAGSAMFLGNDEGQILAASLGLTLDVHIPIGEGKDGEGRVVVGARSRFGAPGPLAARRDGLILLNWHRHYTVLRPASPAEKGAFVLEDGTPYQEVTRTVAGPGGLREVPMIPSDGHCLVGALHYLHFGVAPGPDQVAAHRRLVAGRMSVEALNTLGSELADEIIGGAHLLLPNGCFATLGPAFSRVLQANAQFMDIYRWVLTLQEKDVLSFLGQAKPSETRVPGR